MLILQVVDLHLVDPAVERVVPLLVVLGQRRDIILPTSAASSAEELKVGAMRFVACMFVAPFGLSSPSSQPVGSSGR